MIKYIKLMLFSIFLTSAAYGHNIIYSTDDVKTKCDLAYCSNKYPLYNCPKFSDDWYKIRHHIMTSWASPIPFRQKENKCDKILRHLYIGGIKSIKFCVKHDLVDRIVSFNVSNRHIIPKKFKGQVLTFRKKDNKSTDIVKVYLKSAKFIAGAKKGTLIHCAKGHSRSASLCILYLMARFQVPYADAQRYVKIVRPTIGPKPWFVKQLKEVDYFYLNT